MDVLLEQINFTAIEVLLETLPSMILSFGGKIILTVICFIIGTKLIKLMRKILVKSLEKAKADRGVIQFLDAFVKVALYILLCFLIAGSFGLEAATVVAILGSAGVAIGLALQGSLSNLAGGLLILLLKPFVVGDFITESTNGQSGVVEDIGLFYTKLKMIDNKIIVMPNGTLANNAITNATAMKIRRLDLLIGVSYQADLKDAKAILQKVLEEESLTLKEEEILVFIDELADSSVNIGLRCWTLNEDYWQAKWKITEAAKYALDEANIEIPYPKLDVFVKE